MLLTHFLNDFQIVPVVIIIIIIIIIILIYLYNTFYAAHLRKCLQFQSQAGNQPVAQQYLYSTRNRIQTLTADNTTTAGTDCKEQ
jgi:uncharacterized membrane protein YdbT with pleckstrin-like domain